MAKTNVNLSGYTVSSLTDYVEQKRDVLIKSVVLGESKGDTIANCRKQLGVKGTERLNYLNVDPALQSGAGCGFNASGSTAFTERDITATRMKINDQFCPDDLIGKFAEYAVRIGANGNAENMPFEQEIAEGIAEKIDEKLEKLVWQGSVSGGDLIDGFLTQALGADSAATVNVSIASGSSVYDAIKKVVLAIPENLLDKALVFVSPTIYRAYIQELVEKNYYHYDPAFGEPKDMFFPGTSVKVHNTLGLAGDKKHLYASVWENMVYATDLMNDKEEFRLWFSDDADLFRVKVKWNSGVATLYPDSVVLGTAATDLV